MRQLSEGSVNGAIRNICLALPLLLLAVLPAGAFEIADLRTTPRGLPPTESVLSSGHAGSRPLPAGRRLELVLLDHFGLEPRTVGRIRLEVEEIFASLDTDIGWLHPLSDSHVEAVGTRIRVILTPAAPPKAWGGRGTMGAVVKSERLVENVYVFPPEVMRAMGLKPNRLLVRNTLWARALGRVVAHEIVHAVAPDHPHAAYGLMRGRQSRYSLAGREPEVDALCAEFFLAELESRNSPVQAGLRPSWGSMEASTPRSRAAY